MLLALSTLFNYTLACNHHEIMNTVIVVSFRYVLFAQGCAALKSTKRYEYDIFNPIMFM